MKTNYPYLLFHNKNNAIELMTNVMPSSTRETIPKFAKYESKSALKIFNKNTFCVHSQLQGKTSASALIQIIIDNIGSCQWNTIYVNKIRCMR